MQCGDCANTRGKFLRNKAIINATNNRAPVAERVDTVRSDVTVTDT